MKKYPWYLDGVVVENEIWAGYSLNVLEEIRVSTLKYYENIYDISGLIRDLNRFCSDDHIYGERQEKNMVIFTSGNIVVRRTTTLHIIAEGKLVYTELQNIIPGDWIDDFLKAYETQSEKIKEIKDKIEQANRKQYIEKFFN